MIAIKLLDTDTRSDRKSRHILKKIKFHVPMQ